MSLPPSDLSDADPSSTDAALAEAVPGDPSALFDDLPDLHAIGWSPRWDGVLALDVERDPDPLLLVGRVIAQHRGRWTIVHPGAITSADLPGRFRTLGSLAVPAVGDWVRFHRRADGGGTIDTVLTRASALTRMVAGGTTEPQVIAANVDMVLIVVALDVEPNARRIERQISTVWESGATPVIVATKADLCADLDAARAAIDAVAVGLEVIVTSSKSGAGLDDVAALATPGRTLTLLGTSGAGKSTLANLLLGHHVMAVKQVDAIGKGRHTTTHRQMLLLPTGALIIDTPGMRELGLWVAPGEAGVAETFADVEDVAASCRFSNCGHDGDAGCAIPAAIADGTITEERFDAWGKLRAEVAWVERRQDARLQAEEKKKWAARIKEAKARTRP